MTRASPKKDFAKRRKRQEVTDDDGWTRVTSGPTGKSPRSTVSENDITTYSTIISDPYDEHSDSDMPFDPLMRTEFTTDPVDHPPPNTTVEKIQAKFDKINKIWMESESCSKLHQALLIAVDRNQSISSCLVFGTGSFCGLRKSWIDRTDVALTQLAVFVSVVNTLQEIQGFRPACYAQEPCFNELDIAFLKSHSIEVKDNPDSFDLITPSSFAYAPGAELDVQMRSLFQNPALGLFHTLDFYSRDSNGKADCTRRSWEGSRDDEYYQKHLREQENECQIFERFKSQHDSIKIPDLDAKDYPFWDMELYYRPHSTLQ